MQKYLTLRAQTGHWWDYPAIIASGLTGILAVEVSIDSFTASEWLVSILAGILTTGLVLLPLILIGRRLIRRSTAQKLAKAFDQISADSIPYDRLDSRTHVRNAMKKTRKLMLNGYLQNLELDDEHNCLRIYGKVWNETGAAPKAIPSTGNREFDDKLSEIRRLNDDINDRKVSDRISRIEQLTASIFQVIDAKPERADDARRFMNYYLPTTLKLLESYKLMEKQSYQGENIRVSREKIENVLDTMIRAMEGQQDRLFRYDVLDVESDIAVLDTLMAADGLSERGVMHG